MIPAMKPQDWLMVRPEGLYCPAADLFIDPSRPVGRAVITHGHADHARAGHGSVLATPGTLAVMESRYGPDFTASRQALPYGEPLMLNGVRLTLRPAGHILGSAQVVLELGGQRIIVSGDYKRRADPTCPPFEPLGCDVFITEATFGLPVFRHPDDGAELTRLLDSLRRLPERPHLLGVYALGKCQRLIVRLRQMGFDAPIWLHGALVDLCHLYEAQGVALGDVRPAAGLDRAGVAGALVMAPPSALQDRWSRRLGDPVTAVASGWMRVRARARQRGADLPLVISDHADWDELLLTLDEVQPGEVWVTHGREEALVRAARLRGLEARALALVGFEEEGA
jgi:putative mRNA 3-end processing factor